MIKKWNRVLLKVEIWKIFQLCYQCYQNMLVSRSDLPAVKLPSFSHLYLCNSGQKLHLQNPTHTISVVRKLKTLLGQNVHIKIEKCRPHCPKLNSNPHHAQLLESVRLIFPFRCPTNANDFEFIKFLLSFSKAIFHFSSWFDYKTLPYTFYGDCYCEIKLSFR